MSAMRAQGKHGSVLAGECEAVFLPEIVFINTHANRIFDEKLQKFG